MTPCTPFLSRFRVDDHEAPMPIDVICSCGKKMQAPDEYAGKRARCKGCGEGFTIPNPRDREELRGATRESRPGDWSNQASPSAFGVSGEDRQIHRSVSSKSKLIYAVILIPAILLVVIGMRLIGKALLKGDSVQAYLDKEVPDYDHRLLPDDRVVLNNLDSEEKTVQGFLSPELYSKATILADAKDLTGLTDLIEAGALVGINNGTRATVIGVDRYGKGRPGGQSRGVEVRIEEGPEQGRQVVVRGIYVARMIKKSQRDFVPNLPRDAKLDLDDKPEAGKRYFLGMPVKGSFVSDLGIETTVLFANTEAREMIFKIHRDEDKSQKEKVAEELQSKELVFEIECGTPVEVQDAGDQTEENGASIRVLVLKGPHQGRSFIASRPQLFSHPLLGQGLPE